MPYVLNREQLAWAAGFFDGEGCFTVCYEHHPNKDGSVYHYPKISISQSGNPRLLSQFRRILKFGKVTGPYTKNHKTAKKPRYQYRAGGFEKVQASLCLLWPWLGISKKVQAKNLIKSYLKH